MANTYTSLHYHVIFSTKNRVPWITPDIEARVWRFVGSIARKHAMTALQIGGVEDHLHSHGKPLHRHWHRLKSPRYLKVNHPNEFTASFISSKASPGKTRVVL